MQDRGGPRFSHSSAGARSSVMNEGSSPFLGTAKSDNRLTVNDCRIFFVHDGAKGGRCG